MTETPLQSAAAAVDIDVQEALSQRPAEWPEADVLQGWAELALEGAGGALALRLVDAEEGRRLNHTWRGRDYATNVLSFPVDAGWPQLPGQLAYHGDIAICVPVVVAEAAQQGKTLAAHLCHMVIHGILHLRGFDHIDEAEADEMEAREIALLARLGYPNPYANDGA